MTPSDLRCLASSAVRQQKHLRWAIGLATAFGISNLSAAGPVSSTQVLRTNTTWDGAPLRFAASNHPEVQGVVVEVPPGGATAWHRHPVNNFAYMLAGKIRIELAGKPTTHEFNAGEAFAEVVETWHRGVNIGPGPVKILVFYAGETGVPISITQPTPTAPAHDVGNADKQH